MLILVTTCAHGRGTRERRRLMTFLAWHDCMTADQRKPREIVIETGSLSPAGVLVAFFAPCPKLALMRIVVAVTGNARRRQFTVVKRADVTRIAFDRHVRTAQRILRLVVIEAHLLPIALAVTGFALGAVPAGVDILNLVARNARRRNSCIALARMTA